jgi:hypothetical protein
LASLSAGTAAGGYLIRRVTTRWFLKGSQQARLVAPFMQKERDFVNLTPAAIGFSGYLFLCMFTGFVVTD